MNTVYIATSDGGIEWLHEQPNPTDSDYGYCEFNNNIDALVMGRHTYEKVRTFGDWPYHKKVFVLGSTLENVPSELEGKVELISGKPHEVILKIHLQDYNNSHRALWRNTTIWSARSTVEVRPQKHSCLR